MQEEKKSSKTPQTKSLHDLFLADFQKTRMLSEYHLTRKGEIKYTAEYIIWGDFDAKTKYFSIFLPKSDYTFDACKFLITKYKEILQGSLQTLMKGMVHQAPGATAETFADLKFSGRIYIYHETHLLQERIESLMEEYKKEGLSPQFRGRDYLIMKNSPLYNQHK